MQKEKNWITYGKATNVLDPLLISLQWDPGVQAKPGMLKINLLNYLFHKGWDM